MPFGRSGLGFRTFAALLPLAACGGQGSGAGGHSQASGPAEAVPADAAVSQALSAPPDAGTAAAQAAAASGVGVVSGIIKLADGTQIPLGPDPRDNPGTRPPTAPCAPISDADRRVVFAASGTGGLTPIHVAVTGMGRIPDAIPQTREVRALDCRFQPDLVGARVGDTLRFTNNSAPVLAAVLPGDSFLRTLSAGESAEVKLTRVGVLPAGCPIGAYCGGTHVISVAHPFWAVTNQAGRFRIEGLPLDEEIVVHAWHPLFNEANLTFKLDAAQPEREVVLALTPVSLPAAPTKAMSKAKAALPRQP
jgi:plastocyanin